MAAIAGATVAVSVAVGCPTEAMADTTDGGVAEVLAEGAPQEDIGSQGDTDIPEVTGEEDGTGGGTDAIGESGPDPFGSESLLDDVTEGNGDGTESGTPSSDALETQDGTDGTDGTGGDDQPADGDALATDTSADESETGPLVMPETDAQTTGFKSGANGDGAELTAEITLQNGWMREAGDDGEVFRYYENGVARTGWVITDQSPMSQGTGLQRYWLDANGHLALNRIIDPQSELDRNGWLAFATSDGRVVRGKYVAGTGLVYIADNDGRLYGDGWFVSDVLDGSMQRYWVDATEHACRPGYSSDGWDHYTTRHGYVARGRYDERANGYVYLADNDGRLLAPGWHVSDCYGDGLQRYWVDETEHACVPGYSTDGWKHYVTPRGHVLRGATYWDGEIRIADNDGKLKDGWIVTDVFGYGLQRYWQKDGVVLRRRLVKTGSSSWAYARPEGYVVRGKWLSPEGDVYLANNDGRLENTGWLVTKKYDGDYQRYYIDEQSHSARLGFFSVDGKGYYGLGGRGYVARPGLSAIQANNDGVLQYANGWLVTDAFGQGIQRYWIENGIPVKSRLIDRNLAGWWAYATGRGFVVRGKYVTSAGRVYIADNDGRLADPGWVVSGIYDGSMQRYWVEPDTHAVRTGLFSVNGDEYYGISKAGYVLRGAATVGSKTYVADNDGRLYPTLTATIHDEDGNVTVTQTSHIIGDRMYLFLPSFADVSNLELSATMPSGKTNVKLRAKGTGSYGEMGSIDLTHAGMRRDSDGSWLFELRATGSTARRDLTIMKSASVKTVFVISSDPTGHGQAYVNGSEKHTTKADVQVLVVNPDGSVVYDADVQKGEWSTIKGRGNTTWHGAKKPYQIKLSKKEDLLQTGDKANKSKKWVLLANASDSTLLRTSAVMEYAKALGVGYEDYAPVDFYYDGVYQGSYLLIEKVEIGSGRVDIRDLEGEFEDANEGVDLESLPVATARNAYGYEFQYVVGAKTPKNYAGGYLLEADKVFYPEEVSWFDSSSGPIVVKSPEFCSYEAMKYISEYTQRAFDAVSSTTSSASVSDIVDYDSFVKATLVSEFTRDIEYYVSSTYLYKDANGVLTAGPMWDFDAVFGVRTDDRVSGPGMISWTTRNPVSDSEYLYAKVGNLWRASGSAKAKQMLAKLDSMRDTISASQRMNEKVWGMSSFYNQMDPFPTYEQNYQYLKNWISEQIRWFDAHFA